MLVDVIVGVAVCVDVTVGVGVLVGVSVGISVPVGVAVGVGVLVGASGGAVVGGGGVGVGVRITIPMPTRRLAAITVPAASVSHAAGEGPALGAGGLRGGAGGAPISRFRLCLVTAAPGRSPMASRMRSA